MKRLIIILFLAFVSNLWGQTLFTKEANNYLREGPGPFYNLIRVLPQGTKVITLQKEKRWVKVKTETGAEGWLSMRSLSEERQKKKLSALAKLWSSSKVSRISLAGAIKGLLGKAGKSNQGDFERLLRYSHYSITPTQIASFVKELNARPSENRHEVDWEDADLTIPKGESGVKEMQIGLGVAARLVNEPLIINEEIRNYLYLIMNALTYNSDFYDREFYIFLLNKKQADGFSCPGGYIFLTKGDFLVAQDESELAAVIAHELGHQILRHGEKELLKRKSIIKADEMFAEMDKDINDESNSGVESDLENLIASSYEKTVHTRTLEYELQADRFASILLANAGYDPFAIVRLTSRLAKLFKVEKDIFSDDYLSPNDMQTRAKKIKEFVEENFEKENPGSRLKNRFMNKYKILF